MSHSGNEPILLSTLDNFLVSCQSVRHIIRCFVCVAVSGNRDLDMMVIGTQVSIFVTKVSGLDIEIALALAARNFVLPLHSR